MCVCANVNENDGWFEKFSILIKKKKTPPRTATSKGENDLNDPNVRNKSKKKRVKERYRGRE